MGAPSANLASAGRVNPEGISILYLADAVKTTVHEIRAGAFDYVAVGSFKLKRDIEIIDFAGLARTSPLIANDTMNIGYTEHLNLISQEIAKPLRRHDSALDYLPRQYICDYIKSKGFAGVEYISTMCNGGFNLAIFDESLLTCTKTTIYEIKSLTYDFKAC